MYLVGGDQSIPLDILRDKFGLDSNDVRERMLLGTITKITYRTRKSFEDDGKTEIDFYHLHGEEHAKGIMPVLVYKPRDPSLEIVGGRYFIAPPDPKLGGVSPGIVG